MDHEPWMLATKTKALWIGSSVHWGFFKRQPIALNKHMHTQNWAPLTIPPTPTPFPLLCPYLICLLHGLHHHCSCRQLCYDGSQLFLWLYQWLHSVLIKTEISSGKQFLSSSIWMLIVFKLILLRVPVGISICSCSMKWCMWRRAKRGGGTMRKKTRGR